VGEQLWEDLLDGEEEHQGLCFEVEGEVHRPLVNQGEEEEPLQDEEVDHRQDEGEPL